MDDETFSFVIDAYSPEAFPLERLGAYVGTLGAMLGEGELVEFVGLEPGSTQIVHRARGQATARVRETLDAIAAGRADAGKLRAFESLNKLLREDGASGHYLRRGEENPLLVFPGARLRAPAVIGPIEQETTVDGTLIALGGRDNTVPVRLQAERDIVSCTSTREMARSLAPYLFGEELRVGGIGRWTRHDAEGWRLEHLRILSFVPLGRETLHEAVADLRGVEADWNVGDFREG